MQQGKIFKIASIVGFVLGELYMLYTMLAPNAGQFAPAEPMVKRVLVGAVFMGPFGALVGLGVGLLIAAIVYRGGGKDDDAG